MIENKKTILYEYFKDMELNKTYTLKELGLWKISKNTKMK